MLTAPIVERPTLHSVLSEKGLHGVLFLMGEVMFITRPFIYVLLIRKYGIRSWIPWFISLAVDILGMGSSYAAGSGHTQVHFSTSERDEVSLYFDKDLSEFSSLTFSRSLAIGDNFFYQLSLSFVFFSSVFVNWMMADDQLSLMFYHMGLMQLKRRKLVWALYLMRDPFFSKYTRYWCTAGSNSYFGNEIAFLISIRRKRFMRRNIMRFVHFRRRLENTRKVLEPVPIIGFFTGAVTIFYTVEIFLWFYHVYFHLLIFSKICSLIIILVKNFLPILLSVFPSGSL